jgi:hypothetical protein
MKRPAFAPAFFIDGRCQRAGGLTKADVSAAFFGKVIDRRQIDSSRVCGQHFVFCA